MPANSLHEDFNNKFVIPHISAIDIPIGIAGNLNPAFAIRSYQKKGLQQFIYYWKEEFDGKPKQNHQLLFHMATGSGKTLMMVGLILYLYEQGYRNFLFFVNSKNIINKTLNNFLNNLSSKYLFAESVRYGEKQVRVRAVDNFQSANQEDINIVFQTIQGLHMTLNNPHENSLTEDDFINQKIVLISDEAHHINADTKKANKLSTEEMFETLTWEQSVERLFKANPANVMLEFTATMDFSDDNIEKKYKPKLIFDYPLKEFRIDGYSKEVKVLEADLPSFQRAIQAVLLSQYRRKIFEKYGKAIKPVILFKSKTIKESKAFLEEFKTGIHNLNVPDLEAIRANSSEASLIRMFEYFDTNNITFENLISELQGDFSEDKLIEVNSQEDSETKQIAVNSLEDINNAYRAVFAVDKLNEGWDVLNLFDIVRLYDTRDSKAGKVGKTTMSEAQLIGRGARYCPFKLNNDQPLYERKFDSDLDNELRICEELYYHSALNPKYIQELNTALMEIGIKAKETKIRDIRIKPSFKSTSLYKGGHIFLNKRLPYDRADIIGLDSTAINQVHKITLLTGYTKTINVFDGSKDKETVERKSKEYFIKDFGTSIIRKAMQRLEFYEFASLKRHLPNIKSANEFITSEQYLGRIKIEVQGLANQVGNLSADDKLSATVQVLQRIAEVISSDKVEFKGSKEFTPSMIKDKFIDKKLNFMLDEGSDAEFGKSMKTIGETAYHLNLDTREWYVFDDCFGTSEEKMLIKYIDKRYDELKQKFSEVYLIRNERHFQLFNFDDGRPLEPDFVLYLIGKETVDTMHYQVFIEPKGGHLLMQDKWKEDFLISIKDNYSVEQLFQGRKYNVWGLPFFNDSQRQQEFTEAFNSNLLSNQG